MNNLYNKEQNLNKNILERMNKTFTLKESKIFIKALKDNQYECFLKLIMTYQLSRFELLNLEWKDIDFDNNKISLYLINYGDYAKKYDWNTVKKNESYKRTFPLIPNIKKLLLKEQQKQALNENYEYQNYVCLKNDGTRLNINTLSRNLRNIARENILPEVLLSGLKLSLNDYVLKHVRSNDYYMAWVRFDYKANPPKRIYEDYNLCRNSKFINSINELLECDTQSKMSDSEM